MLHDLENSMHDNTDGYFREYTCHKCGWKIDCEEFVETDNPYNCSRNEYHRWCYNA